MERVHRIHLITTSSDTCRGHTTAIAPFFNKPNLPYSRCNSFFEKERNTVFPHRSKYTVYVTKFYISKSIVVVQCLFPISLPKPIEKICTHTNCVLPHTKALVNLLKKYFCCLRLIRRAAPAQPPPTRFYKSFLRPCPSILNPLAF